MCFDATAALGGILLVVSAGCGSEAGEAHHYFHAAEKPHPAEWGYRGDIGPSHWGDLSPRYALAKTGRQQSPIDIRDVAVGDLPAFTFDYKSAKIDLVYDGHTIEEKEDGESSVTVDGKRYVLEQFHFHAPSEHTIDGRHADMEMHLVHKSKDGAIAVVGVMIRAGAANPAFAPVWERLPTPENKERRASATIDAAKLLPKDHGYYRYMGSFTTPPCTEGVLWLVLRTPVELSQARIDEFRAVMKGNNRPVQPHNDRTIEGTR